MFRFRISVKIIVTKQVCFFTGVQFGVLQCQLRVRGTGRRWRRPRHTDGRVRSGYQGHATVVSIRREVDVPSIVMIDWLALDLCFRKVLVSNFIPRVRGVFDLMMLSFAGLM